MEADARRLQTKEEELLRRKEALRTRLAQLRKERRDLRAAIEANAGRRAPVREDLPPSVCRRPHQLAAKIQLVSHTASRGSRGTAR